MHFDEDGGESEQASRFQPLAGRIPGNYSTNEIHLTRYANASDEYDHLYRNSRSVYYFS